MKILVSAGEASGDLYCSRLITHLRSISPSPIEFFGCAGPQMRATGVRSIVDSESLSVVGLFEVIRHIPSIYGEFNKLIASAKSEKPSLAILTDSPDFHLRLAKKLKKLGIPVVYLVAPQAWAWRPGRARHLGASVSRLLALLPFEVEFFARHGIDCRFVGHPLADSLPLAPDRAAARAALGVAPGLPLVALLPGSRSQEVSRLAPTFAAGVAALAQRRGPLEVVACAAHAGQLADLRLAMAGAAPGLKIEYVHGRAQELLTAADVALVASGTATLEALLCRAPMVVGYRLAPLSYHIIRRMVSIPRIALPNILAAEALVPELIQHELTPRAIERELAAWLDAAARRAHYTRRARELHSMLRVGAAARAAGAVLELCGRA